MTQLRGYYMYLTFYILVCSYAVSSAVGQNNVYTLVFGSESIITDLPKEIKILREKLKEHQQSLNKLQKNYASLQKRFAKLEHTQSLQMNDTLLSQLESFIKIKLNEQSKQLVQKQTNYKVTILNILDTQKKSFEMELKKFKSKVLRKIQSEVDKKANDDKQIVDGKTPIEFLTNLLNNPKQIEKLPPEASTILYGILDIIEGNNPEASNENDGWPTFDVFKPQSYDKVVDVNEKIAHGVEIASSCDETIKSEQAMREPFGGIFALNMTKYNLTHMYGYCLPDPKGDGSWLVIQRRVDNKLSFNRSWQEYKSGFGHLTDSFFIGLERLHKILLHSHTHLWIQVGTKADEGYESAYRMYTGFDISNEENKYKLNTVHIEDLMDDLADAKGKSFQTYDVENGENNCAQKMAGGWWYDETRKQDVCANGNLNANLEQVNWNGWHKVVYTHMALKFSDPAIKANMRWKDLSVD